LGRTGALFGEQVAAARAVPRETASSGRIARWLELLWLGVFRFRVGTNLFNERSKRRIVWYLIQWGGIQTAFGRNKPAKHPFEIRRYHKNL